MRDARGPVPVVLVPTARNIGEKARRGKPEARIPHALGQSMKRPSGPTLAAVVFSLLVGLLYVSPVVKDVRRTGLDWPIWIDHPEGLIHTNTGKWLVAPPHRPFVEGASGEFPQYYPSLSDTLINLVGGPLGIPAMTVQAVLFGPLLGCAFLLFNYLSLAAVLRDRRAALAASLVLSLGGNSSFLDRVDPASGLPLNAVLHVPFHVISLGTSQSLGWVLLLPTLCLAYLAYRELDRRRALAAGVLLGVLFHSHTLTFVNVAAVELAYLVLANLLERPRDRRFKAWLLSLGLLDRRFRRTDGHQAEAVSSSASPCWVASRSSPLSSSTPTSASTCGATCRPG